MNAALGVLIIGVAIIGACRVAMLSRIDRLSAMLVGVAAFFALFLMAFFVQGFLELVSHRPVIGLPLTALLVSLFVATTFFVRRSPTVSEVAIGTRWPDASRPLRRVPLVLGVTVACVFVLLAALLLLGLPRGYEVRAYHLPIAARILRDGTLSLWDSAFMHAYPANMSIWAGFLMSFLPERVIAIANFPFAALLAAATYGLCRSVGSDRSAAVIVAAGLLTIPLFGFSTLEVGADVAGMAFMTVAAYLIIARPSTAGFNAAFAGVASGLAFGFKSLNLIPIAFFGLFVVLQGVHDWRRADRGKGGRVLAACGPTLLFIAGALAMMGFWLCRNYIEAGNPLYPVHVKGLFDLLGWKAAPNFDLSTRSQYEREWVTTSAGWLVYPWVEGHFIQQNFKHSSGLGPFFAATIPVVVLLWPLQLIGAWRDRVVGMPDRRLVGQAVLYVVAMIVFVAWWFLGDRQPRYFMGAIALLVPLAALLLSANTGRVRTAYEILLSFCILTMAFVMIVRLGIENGPFLLKQRGASRWQALEYPSMIDRLPPGSVILNAIARPISYSLLGDGLVNHVVDSAQTEALFGGSDETLRLTKDKLVAIGATHLYADRSTKIETEGCVRLRELQRLDRNPFNAQPYDDPRVLYAIDLDCAPSARP